MTWSNPRPGDTSDEALRAIFRSLESYLADPSFENGVSLGDGSAPTYNAASGTTTPPTTVLVDSTTTAGWTAAGVEVVAALPALPDASYGEGKVVFLTTDDKLYRSTGAAWTRAVDGGDLTASTVTADAILAGTITAAELASDSVTANELAALNIAVGKYLRSTTYTAGSAGWAIDADGSAEFNDVTVRGDVTATGFTAQGKALTLSGLAWSVVAGTGTFSDSSGAAVTFTAATQPWTIMSSTIALPPLEGVASYLDRVLEVVGATSSGYTTVTPDPDLGVLWYNGVTYLSTTTVPATGVSEPFSESEGTFLTPPATATHVAFAWTGTSTAEATTMDLGTVNRVALVSGGVFRTDQDGTRGLVVSDDRVNGQIRFLGDGQGGSTPGGIAYTETGTVGVGEGSRQGSMVIQPPMVDSQTARGRLRLLTDTDPTAGSPLSPSEAVLEAQKVTINGSTTVRFDGGFPEVDQNTSGGFKYMPLGVVDYGEDTAARNGFTTILAVNANLQLSFYAYAGRRYKFTFGALIESATANTGVLFMARESTTERCRLLQDNDWPAATARPERYWTGVGTYSWGSSGTKTVDLSVQRTGGAGSLNVRGDLVKTWFMVEDIGV